MNIQSRPQLEAATGQAIPLVGMDIKAKIEGLLTSICVEQTYHNTEKVNIEAVYTFPLPMAAVLTRLQVNIADRLLSAKILEKTEAEACYEEAITDGNRVVMLQKLESGLYSMNIGNLQADETISVQMEYAFVQTWQANQLRLMLPTTVAPRYGNDPFAPHQMPETNVFVEHKYQLEVIISGALAKAKISSPSHRLITQGQGDLLSVSLQDKAALMDKDFVLLIESEQDHNLGLVSKDKKGYCALASFHPQFAAALPTESKNFKIVVDCSGSMGGVSIEQARLALEKIVGSLDAGDFFNIVKFGSSHESMFNTMVPATHTNIQYALKEIARIDANLGGTEIGSALQAAYQLNAESKQADEILLITDGEVWNTEPILQNAVKSKHRIFTVGVGVAVSEAFVRGLAEQTGGACELVSPNEDMAEKIVRHFARMRTPAAKSVRVEWSDTPELQLDIGAVYSGDTLNVWAWFDKQPGEQVSLQLQMGDGQVIKQFLSLTQVESHESLHTLARLAAAKRMGSLQEKNEIVAIACDYQLMSVHTNYLMVDEEGPTAEELPELRKVPQMMPDMWLAAPAGVALRRSRTANPAVPFPISAAPASMDYLSQDVGNKSDLLISKIQQVDIEKINLDDLHNFDCDHLDLLIDLQQQGYGSHEIAITYLYYYLQSLDSNSLQERSLRKLVKHFKHLSIESDLIQAVKKILEKLPGLPVFW